MMDEIWTTLGEVEPTALVGARNQAHRAVQWVARAARANLEAKPDDSHSNLVWRATEGALVSHDLPTPDGKTHRLGLAIGDMKLSLDGEGAGATVLELGGQTDAEVGTWVDGILTGHGLKPASEVALPYDIPDLSGPYGASVSAIASTELARWFAAAADVLEPACEQLTGEVHTVSPLRCWPHHFDIAMLASLEAGDPETAPAIGIGLSPGDGYYPQPYFYINPWPSISADTLPTLGAPGCWHTQDFVGIVATAGDILKSGAGQAEMVKFLDHAIATSRELLGT
jgi:hypothetical protein